MLANLRRTSRRMGLILAILLAATAQNVCSAADTEPEDASIHASDIQRLDDLLRAMPDLLDKIGTAATSSDRDSAMRAHWQAMQDYMATNLKMIKPQTMDLAMRDCRIVGSAWRGLSFPSQAKHGDYLERMQAHMQVTYSPAAIDKAPATAPATATPFTSGSRRLRGNGNRPSSLPSD